MEDLDRYKAHVIEQAVTSSEAGHEIRCMFTTPKLLEALAEELEDRGTSIREIGHHGHLRRRHGVHAAVHAIRDGGTARRAACT